MSTENTEEVLSTQKRGVTIRLEDEYFDQLEEIARRERRSMSGQAGLYVIQALEEAAA